jgi:hypothetical protein
MFENLSEEIRKCRRRAEECKRKSEIALTASAIQTYLDMERGWLALARSYELEMLWSLQPPDGSLFLNPWSH